jgi:phosphoribosylanthranilate isomerase
MKLKICGMKNPENIIEIAKLEPEFMGYIFWPSSPRYFEGPMPETPKHIHKVGVFVNAAFEEILSKKKKYHLDIIQLHGNETADFCKRIQLEGLPVIKVFSIDTNFDFSSITQYHDCCDYYLFDTKGQFPGGNGATFEWNLLKEFTFEKPIFISGGVGIAEIEKIEQLGFPVFGIDMNSKLEDSPGLKNINSCREARLQINKKKYYELFSK